MPTDRATLRETFRSMHARPGGTGALLNLLRSAKVRAAADTAVLSELAPDPARRLELARHARDEARHACGLLERMAELGAPAFRVAPALDPGAGLLERSRARDPKRVWADRGVIGDPEMMELALTSVIAKEDAVATLAAARDALVLDPESRALVAEILRDDQRHLGWLSAWLGSFEDRFSPRAVAAARQRLEHAFAELAGHFGSALGGYFDRAAA